jgi:sorbitol-specific phosphotransferase system component IIA
MLFSNMLFSHTFFSNSRRLKLLSVCLLCLAPMAIWGQPARGQIPIEEFGNESEEFPPFVPQGTPPLQQTDSLLSLTGGQRLLEEASFAVDAQDYDLASQKLQEARQVFNQLSNFYQQLAGSFAGIDGSIAEQQRKQALETAQLRDRATYQLALVHRAQNQPELSVPLLVQIVRSQNPTTDLGRRAYDQLTELGFEQSQDPSEEFRPLRQSDSILSLAGGKRFLEEATTAFESQNYTLAVQKLQEARQVFNQLSNFYQQLAGSFAGINARTAESQRVNALEAAQLRDDATYQLAVVHRAQNQPELSVPLLVQIVRSQNPTTNLGQRAYQQLLELGFVTVPFPSPSENTSSSN